MKAIRSVSITYKGALTLEKICHFFKKVTHYKSNLFLNKGQVLTNCDTFSSLVSFFTTLKKGDTFLLILEGDGIHVERNMKNLSQSIE